MLQPRRRKSKGGPLALYLLLLVLVQSVLGNEKEAYRDSEGEGSHLESEQISLDRRRRESSGITTILLVNNDDDRSGRSARPSGVLTSTARTFVHDGTTTEFATQIVGTTLNHGQYYAQLLQTTSRIYFGDQDKLPPKTKPDDRAFYKTRYIGLPQNVDNYISPSILYDIRPSEPLFIYPTRTVSPSPSPNATPDSANPPEPKENELVLAQTGNVRQFPPRAKDSSERELLENLIRLEKSELFNKRNADGIKPSKVFPNLLPTVTIRHDFAPSGFSVTPEEKKEEAVVKSDKSKLRSGKSLPGKPADKKYDTVTYLGFADFITTVGNTVIVFMPNTRAGDQTAQQTSVAQETTSSKPSQEVMTTVKTFMSHSPGMVTKTVPGHSLSMQTTLPTSVADRKSKGMEEMELKSSVLAKEQILFENPVFSSVAESSNVLIEPSESVTYSSISRSSQTATEPLATFATTVTRTFSNGGSEKPLGLLKSIGGTKAYNGTTTHFTSLVYGTYVDGSYAQILKTSSSVFYLVQSAGDVSATVVLDQSSTKTQELHTTTASASDDEELLETSEGDADEEERTTVVDATTVGSVEEEGKAKEEAAVGDVGEKVVEKPAEVIQTSTEELITRLVPSTVYKTFTYLTTFFIPSDETTTTSIRSREVVTSDVNIITKVIDPNLVSKEVFPTVSVSPSKTAAVDSEDVDPEFRVPSLRVLAPEGVVVIEDTEDERETTPKSEEPATSKETEPPATTVTESLAKDTTNPPPTTLEDSENLITTTEELKPQEPPKEPETTTPSDDEEVEVIFKTLYTTYTYLTTFFHESTTSISSSEVVVTNVITSTLDAIEATPSVKTQATRGPDEEPKDGGDDLAPTSVVTGGSETKFFDDDDDDVELSPSLHIPEQTVTETPAIQTGGLKTLFTTYTYFTTLFDNGSTDVKSRTEVVTNVVGPSSVSVLPSSILHDEALFKSKFEMLLREQQSQRAAASARASAPASSIAPSVRASTHSGSSSLSSSVFPSRSSADHQSVRVSSASAQRASIRPSSAARGKYGTITRRFKIPVTPPSDLVPSERDEDNSVTRSVIKGEKRDRTIIRKRIRTKSRLLSRTTNVDDNLGITTIRLDPTPVEEDATLLQTMVTDIKSSSSGGGRQIRIAPPVPVAQSDFLYDDQISSESNTEEIEPSPTLILQTSYTTFTYFTTVYKGSSSSDVISRLETVTNIVTETVKPELLVTQNLSPEDATLPITYFTTFTYWTTLYKDGNTVITSREETVSNVVTPTITASPTELSSATLTQFVPAREPTTPLDTSTQLFVPAFVPAAVPDPVTEPPPPETPSPINTKPIENLPPLTPLTPGAKEGVEPTTYYTTYTYFTTSYIGESTVLKSRLETVTNVVSATPTISEILENDLQTGRAINAGSSNKVAAEESEGNTANALQTGLLSTVVSTEVNEGKTTLYSTDIFGTFIDGLYAKVLESTTKVVSEAEVAATSSSEIQKTGIVSINEGKIVDADGISTTFFTTKAIGTSIEQLYAQVVESTSSVLVDNDKKSALAGLQGESQVDDSLRTGLVRLIEGSIIKDGTTTLYESRVIGTVIDGRYAQIIESTSTYKIEPSIAPSVTIKTEVTPTSSVELTSPSPSAIEGSEEVKGPEEEGESEEEEEGEDEKDKGRVKSRLTFQSRKRTFTPVIRPFASRNRPTFLPKKKTVGTAGAQTITRANFTPTITATPATKTEGFLGSSRNRFGGGRKSSALNVSPEVKPTATAGGRKFGRNRTSFSSPTISSSYAPSRGRSSARVSPTPTLNLSSTRGRGSFRGSSARAGFNFESGAARPSLSPVRPRIRPTLSGLPGRGASVSTEPPHDKSNDLTTVVTEEEESGFTADEETVPVTTPTTTTTEDPNLARRNNNPLLRFRRPLVPKASTTSTTPKPVSTQAPRRGLLNNRNRLTTAPAAATTPRSANSRTQNTFASRANVRPRPVNNLFPPRGLFKKPTPQEVEKEEEEVLDEEEEEEIENEDNNYEESSAKEVEAEAERKSDKVGRGRGLNAVSIRPFSFQRRSKRQVPEYGTRNRQYSETAAFTPRYRRPKPKPVQAQERFDYYDDEYLPSEPPKPLRNGRTYTPRTRTNTQATNPPTQPRIRPTTASSQNSQRAPFTIREKDNANPRQTNFRRGQTSSRRKTNYKATEPTVTRKSSRARTSAQNQALNDLTRSNQRRGYSNSRRVSPSRSRSRFGEAEDSFTFQQPVFDGTITVTHKIPSEATIPVVNGKVTEYRNVITAKPSIEVLGPHQYTVSTTNGGTVLFLNREVTETLTNGVTEVTRFLLHETPTTSVTFTPTTIRGRKTSFSHIIPSTVYDVENVVTTLQPQLAPNAPLANILLSQLLLGNLNIPPNQPLPVPPAPTAVTPVTEFKTRTTTYVTSVTEHISTVLPITFRGKEILTTIVDNTVNVITATEFITDTIVVTPTLNQNHQINSLLLPALLQAQLQQVTPPQLPSPALTQLPFGPGLGLDQLKLEALQQQELKVEELGDERSKVSKDNDIRLDRESEESIEEERGQRGKGRRKGGEKKRFEPEPAKEVITLYVSGRRPGEFSTILSTVISGETSAAVRKRETPLDDIERLLVEASEVKQVRVLASKEAGGVVEGSGAGGWGAVEYYVRPGMAEVSVGVGGRENNAETESLESVLGDVSKHVTGKTATATATAKATEKVLVKPTRKNVKKSTENVVSEGGRSLGQSHVELRYNLATKVMRNGVEVIVATERKPRPVETEYLRHLSSTVTRPITLAPHTLTNLMSMVLPTDDSDDNHRHLMSLLQPSFVTRTFYTTYNYPTTIYKDNSTRISTTQTTLTNLLTEQLPHATPPLHDIQPTPSQPITLTHSPTLHTQLLPTAYTYYHTFLDGDHPILLSSTHTLSNTLVAPFLLEPSEAPAPSTNTYYKTIALTTTITDGTDSHLLSTNDLLTQVVVTDTLPPHPSNLPVTTHVTKTYFVTYTYFSTYIDGDQTKVKSDVSVSSDVTIEKFYIKPKKTETTPVVPTPKPPPPHYPFRILAPKTHFTTFTYFTTLFHGTNDQQETSVSTRTKVVEDVVTETIPLQDLATEYLLRLNNSLNRITGSLVATATLKGGETLRVTAHRNAPITSSYLHYQIKPTKTVLQEEAATELFEKSPEILKTKSSFSKSNYLLSKTKTTLPQKSKIKPSKTLIREATAEALVATKEEPKPPSPTPTVTFTPATLTLDYSAPPTASSASTPPPEEQTASTSAEHAATEEADTRKPPAKQPGKQPVKQPGVNVTNLLNLNSLGINGMTVLGPVFNAMAELIHNNLNKNVDSLTRRNDSAASEPEPVTKKPATSNSNPLLSFVSKFTPPAVKGTAEPKVKVTTPRAPVYIPVGSFATDSEFGESQDSEVTLNRPENWHDKWTDAHANFEKGRPHDPPITILEGGIPISPGQVITTNSDVIIGRPGETGPRPPTFAIKNNVPVDMKPPPPPHPHFTLQDEDGFVAQHSTNQGVDLGQDEPNLPPPRPPLLPPNKRPHPLKPHRPHPNDRFKQKPPLPPKPTEYDSGTLDLNPPPVPPPPVRSHDVHHPITINHEQPDDPEPHKPPPHNIPIPLHLTPHQNVENYLNPAELGPAVLPIPTFPALHQEIPAVLSDPTPHVNPNGVLLVPTVALNLVATENPVVVDRSTGQQLLVNIQPSQVANIVIPHGSSTALILSDGKQHSLKGEVIDDPSPHPEPETVGFVGAEPVLKIENEDIGASFHNDVVPAEAEEVAQQSGQDHRVGLSKRPHLTTELIKIRPKPAFDAPKEHLSQHVFLGGQQQPDNHLPTAVTFVGNHRPAEHSHQIELDVQRPEGPKAGTGIYATLQFSGEGAKGSQVNQNYRKEGLSASNVAGNLFAHEAEGVPPIQGQQKFHNYLVNSGGLYAEQNKFIQRPGPVRGGNGIYVDISPPGHLPPRPNLNLLHQIHSSEKQPPAVKEHLVNHQSGHVHDVPLNAQVQLGSSQKENPLKEILISANTNNHDSIYDPKKNPTENKFLENHMKRPLPELPENLSPPPLSKDTAYRIHRPSPFIPPPQKYPSHPNVPKPPPDFMIPPPQPPKPHPTHPHPHPRPIIPIGALAPQQSYPNPRPEDILIVPHKNRPPFNYVTGTNQDIKQSLGIHSDLDVSDSSDPIKTEYGEEIQESISRPLFPGQLPAELQKLNASYNGFIHNHKDDLGKPMASEGSEAAFSGLGGTKTETSVSNHHQQKKPPTASHGLSSINQAPFFSLIKKPSGFVTSNANQREPSGFANHNLDGPTAVKAPAKGGNIRIHAVGPSVLPSGFVKNENAVDHKRQPIEPGEPATSSVQESATNSVTTNSGKNKPNINVPKKEPPAGEVLSGPNAKDETKDNGAGATATGTITFAQNKVPGRHEPPRGYHKPDSSDSNQKFGAVGQTTAELQEAQSGPIQFDSSKVPVGYPTSGLHKGGTGAPQRYPNAATQIIKPSKRPSGFTSPKKEEKPPATFPSDNAVQQPPPHQPSTHSKIPSGFTYRNESQHSFTAAHNHKYGNASLHFYEPKPSYDVNEERDVAYKPDEKWFSGFGNPELKKPTARPPPPPPPHRNSSSLPTKVLPPDSDVHMTLLPPPRTGDPRPKPTEDVMGLSPPPLERPRRPQRPKPPFAFDKPTTPKSTLPPIAIENDFPPVRSPDFNRKPIKPQDIFPPRLPDNFIHHLPDYPVRNHPPQRPVTSLPIDTPTDPTTDNNHPHDSFFAASDINGHSKPITDEDPSPKPLPPPPPPPSSTRLTPSRPPPSPSTIRLNPSIPHHLPSQPPKPPSTVRLSTSIPHHLPSQPPPPPSIPHHLPPKPAPTTSRPIHISPTPTPVPPPKTTFHTKLTTSVTPTTEHSDAPHSINSNWHYPDIITGSETVFDPDRFSSYHTPTIRDTTTKKNIVTTLVTTGSTTIFADLFNTKLTAKSTVQTASAVGDRETSSLAPTKTTVHTTTLTVTTTMTTVVHSIGHKPSTKTIVLTKTLISTVVNKVTETKTLVRPTTATIIQTHTVATTKTALVVPTALYPPQTKYPAGTLKPEIFLADPHAKDTMTISVSSSMNKNKHAEDTRGAVGGTRKESSEKDSLYVVVANRQPDEGIDVISREEGEGEGEGGDSRVVVGGVFDASEEREVKEKRKEVECNPGCKGRRNELCQRVEGHMKCVCRPGFARMFPDRPCRPTYTYNVQLMLEKLGSTQISQEKSVQSPNMAQLASAAKEGLDRMIMQSELRDIYHGVIVNGFQGKEKKTMVDFYVQLSENTDEAKLMEILKKTLQTSNYSLGGTELFAAREADSLSAEDFNECLSSKFHDCSENARCFNLKGTYTCSCKEGFTDLSENSQFPGRVCSDTIGCEYCGYHGACYSKGEGQLTCECFQWYSGERCHINLKVLLIALVTIGAVLLGLLLVCAVMTCLNRRSRGSSGSRTNGSSAGYLRYRGPSSQSLDRRAMIADSSSESSVENLPYVCAPPLPAETMSAKKKPALRHGKGPAPRPLPPPGMEQRDRSVTVMIPRAKYRPMPPLSPHLTMSTFSPDKHLSKTAAQIATEQKLINYLDGNTRDERTLGGTMQSNRQSKEQQKNSEYKTPSPNGGGSPKPEQKKDSKVFEYEYKISNMLFTEETNSTDKRSFKSLDDRFRRHSDSTHLNSDSSNRNQFRKYSAGALVSAGYEVSAKVGMHHLEEDTTEDEHSAIINTIKSTRSQFTTLNRTGDHKTMSEARSYDETTVHPPTRSLKTHYSGSSPSSRVNNDEGHTMIERDLGSTFIMPESQLFKPEADRGSDISNFDSL